MRASLHIWPHLHHQALYGDAMEKGLRRHGVEVVPAYPNQPVRDVDFAVMWGWKQPAIVEAASHVLVMEATHLREGQPRNISMASCGWDGLAGRGRYAKPDDGERWRRHWPHLMEDWTERDGYALLIGQVDGDPALNGENPAEWVWYNAKWLKLFGWKVVYRPHPLSSRVGPKGVTVSTSDLYTDLEGAALCVTYNSTTAVESVLAGVPTVAFDEGSMAWPVTGHDLTEIVRPDRTEWAHALAWTSFTIDEIESGFAWEHLEPVMQEEGCWSRTAAHVAAHTP